MADDRRILISSEPKLTADEIVRRTFATGFRGFEPSEVRAFLKRVGEDYESALQRERELRKALDQAEDRAAHPVLDEATLTAALGEETARVLRSAREAATEITARGEEKAARLAREAQDE